MKRTQIYVLPNFSKIYWNYYKSFSMQKTKQQKLCLNVSRRNKKMIEKLEVLMSEKNLSMTDTVFQIIKKEYESYESKQRNRQLLGVWMSSSQVYISTASRDRLRAIARKHFMKESDVLDQLILETHNKMKNAFGRKVLWEEKT